MEPVNFGVMGASSFALAQTARAIHEARGARFAALATSSAAKAEPFKAFAPDLVVHLDYDAMLADPTIEAVYIPLPNHLHVEWTLKALEAGKHVLTEKPIAMTAPEIDALIAARDRTGLFASEAYMIVHHPQWQRVRTPDRRGRDRQAAARGCGVQLRPAGRGQHPQPSRDRWRVDPGHRRVRLRLGTVRCACRTGGAHLADPQGARRRRVGPGHRDHGRACR